MNKDLHHQFSAFGFSDKETRVYLSAIELGASSVQTISTKSGVNRATAYVIIESLIERGLISTSQSGKKRLFVAEPPETIINIIQREKKRLEEKERGIKSVLTELVALSHLSKNHPNVTFHEGENGVESIRDSIFKSGARCIEEFSNLDLAYRYFPPSSGDHREKFRKLFDNRLIYTSERGAILPVKQGRVETRFVPLKEYPFYGEVAIFGDKLAIIYYSPKLIGVLVEHEGIANLLHNLFSLAWVGTKKEA